jgi:hypothetical protein
MTGFFSISDLVTTLTLPGASPMAFSVRVAVTTISSIFETVSSFLSAGGCPAKA